MKYAIATLALILCTSCSPLSIHSVQEPKPILNLAQPAPVQMQDVKVQVKDKYICLTEEGYRKMLVNLNILKSYIILQQDIIYQYKEYYEPIQSK